MCEQTTTQKIISQSSIKLTKNAKGEYQWEIKAYDEFMMKAFEIIVATDERMKQRYGSGK